MCLGAFSRLRRSLAASTLYAAVRILAERFLLYRKAISCKVKKLAGVTPASCVATRLLTLIISISLLKCKKRIDNYSFFT